MNTTASAQSTDSTPALQFIAAISDPSDILEFRCINGAGYVKRLWSMAGEVGTLMIALGELNRNGFNIYLGINPRRELEKSGDANVLMARCVFGDFDNTTEAEARRRIEAAKLPTPSFTNWSGHGVHAYWILAEPITDLSAWADLQSRLAALLGSDPVVVNPERIMRLPGTTNRKEPDELVECRIIEREGSKYEWAEILALIPKLPGSNGDDHPHPAPAVGSEIVDGKRNTTLASEAGTMRRRGMAPAAIEAGLLAENRAKCRPLLADDEVRRIAQSVSKYPPGDNYRPDAEPPPAPATLRELWRTDPELREPVIDGLARRGQVCNIVSTSKAYKTFLVLQLAVCMAMKKLWLDVFPTIGGRVLIIDLELQKPDITKRTHEIVKALHAPLETADQIDVISFRGRSGNIEDIEAMLLKMEPQRYSLVILDPLYKSYPPDFEENGNAPMTVLYRRFERIAEHMECALVIVHHATKGSQGEKRVVDVGAGAGSQSRSADCHIALREHEQDGCVVFDARVRSFRPPDPLVLRFNFPIWERDLAMDPSRLKTGRSSRNNDKPKSQSKEKSEPWTVDRFAKQFLTNQPQDKKIIVARARQAGVQYREIDDLLALASAEKRSFRWVIGKDKTVYLATVEQPLTLTGKKS